MFSGYSQGSGGDAYSFPKFQAKLEQFDATQQSIQGIERITIWGTLLILLIFVCFQRFVFVVDIA